MYKMAETLKKLWKHKLEYTHKYLEEGGWV
jgi:hypothetical protein